MVGWITGTRAMFGIHLLVAVVVFVYFAVVERGDSMGLVIANGRISISACRIIGDSNQQGWGGPTGVLVQYFRVPLLMQPSRSYSPLPPPGIAAEILRELPRHRGGLQFWGQIESQTLQVPKRLPL